MPQVSNGVSRVWAALGCRLTAPRHPAHTEQLQHALMSTHRLQAGDPSTDNSAANCQGRSQVTHTGEFFLLLNDLQLISSNVPLEWQHHSMIFPFPVAPCIYDLHLPAEFTWKYLRALSHSSALAEGSKPTTGTHKITTQGGGLLVGAGVGSPVMVALPSRQQPRKGVPVQQGCRSHSPAVQPAVLSWDWLSDSLNLPLQNWEELCS